MLPFKSRYTSQPQGAVEIDWSNSFGKKVRHFYIPGSIGSPPGIGSSKFGRTAVFNNNGTVEMPNSYGAFLSGMTVIAIGKLGAKGAIAPIITRYDGNTAGGFELTLHNNYAGGTRIRGMQNAGSAFSSGYVDGVTDALQDNIIVNLGRFYTIIGCIDSLPACAYNIAIGGLQSGTFKLSGEVVAVAILDGILNQAEAKEITQNPWQIFKPQSRSLWIPGTASAPAGHTLTAATTAQSSSSSPGSITQSHTLSGSATSQSATSGTGAITHGTTHVLTAASSTQSSTASAGAVTQGHTLTGAASSQSAGSSTGAVIAGFVHVLTGATSSQSAASSTGAITQSHVLVCAPSVQDSIAGASSIVQAHVLVAGGCSQLAVSGVGAVWDGVAIPGLPTGRVTFEPSSNTYTFEPSSNTYTFEPSSNTYTFEPTP